MARVLAAMCLVGLVGGDYVLTTGYTDPACGSGIIYSSAQYLGE